MCTHGRNEYETCEICDAEHGLPPLNKLVPPYNKIFPIETEALAQGRKLMQQYVQDRMRMQGVVSGYFSQINELIVTGHNISVNKVVETASKDVVIVFRLSRSPITDLCEGKA